MFFNLILLLFGRYDYNVIEFYLKKKKVHISKRVPTPLKSSDSKNATVAEGIFRIVLKLRVDIFSMFRKQSLPFEDRLGNKGESSKISSCK